MWTVSRRIKTTPESAWRVLVDLDAWPQWGLSVQRAELSSGTELTLGSVGKVWTGGHRRICR
jgi:Polyketide cyclase / dehydrase and lipid transport